MVVGAAGLTYTPAANYFGDDAFSYTVRDNENAKSNTATVSITVRPVNDPPVAVNDTAATSEESAVTIDVLQNDHDIDGTVSGATLVIVNPPANGTAGANLATGQITYTPGPEFAGTDVFKYTVADNQGLTSNVAQVVVVVSGSNDAPLALPDSATTNEDQPVQISLTENDNDPEGQLDQASVEILQQPGRGTVAFTQAPGQVRYTPEPDFFGSDQFTYRVKDQQGSFSNVAAVHVSVVSVNDPPLAVDDAAVTPENTTVVVPVLDNDSDVEGPLTGASLTLTRTPTHGVATIQQTTISYTPQVNFSGTDTLAYVVQDNQGATSNQALVVIAVSSVNLPPEARDDSVVTRVNLA
ncbi:MAG: tandem-95 repeat protein, partial [Candidatus Zixiibacteriota bacterium]